MSKSTSDTHIKIETSLTIYLCAVVLLHICHPGSLDLFLFFLRLLPPHQHHERRLLLRRHCTIATTFSIPLVNKSTRTAGSWTIREHSRAQAEYPGWLPDSRCRHHPLRSPSDLRPLAKSYEQTRVSTIPDYAGRRKILCSRSHFQNTRRTELRMVYSREETSLALGEVTAEDRHSKR